MMLPPSMMKATAMWTAGAKGKNGSSARRCLSAVAGTLSLFNHRSAPPIAATLTIGTICRERYAKRRVGTTIHHMESPCFPPRDFAVDFAAGFATGFGADFAAGFGDAAGFCALAVDAVGRPAGGACGRAGFFVAGDWVASGAPHFLQNFRSGAAGVPHRLHWIVPAFCTLPPRCLSRVCAAVIRATWQS